MLEIKERFLWAHLRDTVYATAASTLDNKKRKNQDWFDENDGAISCLLEQKRIALVKTLEDPRPSIVQAHKDICSSDRTLKNAGQLVEQ